MAANPDYVYGFGREGDSQAHILGDAGDRGDRHDRLALCGKTIRRWPVDTPEVGRLRICATCEMFARAAHLSRAPIVEAEA